jgi:hypothetical protein
VSLGRVTDVFVRLLVELLDNKHSDFSFDLGLDDAFKRSLELASYLSKPVAFWEVQVNESCIDTKDSVSSIEGWDSNAITHLSHHVDI